MYDNPEAPRQDALREAQKRIIRSLFLALASLGIIVFACYAWIANNRTVSSQILSINLFTNSFELASIGNDGLYTTHTPEQYRVEDGASWKDGTGKYTAGKSAIVWQLDSNSHMNNSSASEKQGIRPGSYGTLQFYVIPKIDGSLNLQFNLDLIPVLNPNLNSDENTLNQLMHGHMLFSYQCKEDSIPSSTPTLIDLQNPSFSLNFEKVSVDQEILVTMKWIWPYVLDDVKNNNLNDVCSGESIVALMKEKPFYFFYNAGNEFTTPISNEAFINDYQEYDNYFNAADQYLGERINWLIVRMTAQTA